MTRLAALVLIASLALAGNAVGQDVPPGGWTGDVTLGNADEGDSVSPAPGVYEVTGNGNDIQGTADAGQFLYKVLTGDGSMSCRVTSNGTGSNAWCKGGIMIRQTTDTGSMTALMPMTGGNGNGSSYQWRLTNGGGTGYLNNAGVVAIPYYVKIERIGNEVSGYHSPDGIAWTQLSTAQIMDLGETALIGLAVTSHAAGELRTYTFDNISFEGAVSGETPPGAAMNPSPSDEEVDVSPDVTLSWTPGMYASEHDVYLGTDFDEVNDATVDSALYVGRQSETSYAPADLELGQMYYWRVDEPNDTADKFVWKGPVWSFELEPVSFAVPISAVSATASSADADTDPNNTVNGVGLDPNTGAHSTSLEAMWAGDAADATPSIQYEFAQVEKLDKVHVWNHNTQTESILGFGIKEALIEYSVDGETWSELGTVELAQAPGNATYTGADVALDMIVAKYVKITALSNYSILGLPQKGLAEVRFYAVPMRARSEIPTAGSTGLDPLIELSWRAGREAVKHEILTGTDPNNLTLVATVDDAAYTAAVDMDSTVYLQVNEINDAMDPASWEGDIWTMATAEFITVDDMESYKSIEGSYVWETWVDGFGDDNNGALLGHNGDDMETDAAYDGGQSLPFYYGQGGATSSEAFRDIERDWGQHGIVSLSLMFYGSPSNIAGPMYVKVNDEKIATYPTNSDLTVSAWQAWTIDLPASALGNVKSLAIGFESGTGLVLIDAIRLYAKASETVTPVVPDDTGLVAFYPFEGNANDASGNGNDGTEEGGPQYVTGQVGQAMDFDGIDDFVSTGKVASQLGIDGNKPRTVSCWVYTRGYADGGIYDVGARVATEDFCLRTLGDVVDQWRVQYWGGDADFTFNTLERWVNFVHVHDGTHTMVYGDGRTLVNWEKTIDTTDTNPFQIGCYGWQVNFFYGVIDEVRLYDRALTQAEALGLAGRTEPIFKEF